MFFVEVACPFVLFHLAIVLSILRFTASDYPFVILSVLGFTASDYPFVILKLFVLKQPHYAVEYISHDV